MKDESLIEEMRAALNGDRERAEIRRRQQQPDDGRCERAAAAEADSEAARPGFLARIGLRRPKS